jgi:hypothetical protein
MKRSYTALQEVDDNEVVYDINECLNLFDIVRDPFTFYIYKRVIWDPSEYRGKECKEYFFYRNLKNNTKTITLLSIFELGEEINIKSFYQYYSLHYINNSLSHRKILKPLQIDSRYGSIKYENIYNVENIEKNGLVLDLYTEFTLYTRRNIKPLNELILNILVAMYVPPLKMDKIYNIFFKFE